MVRVQVSQRSFDTARNSPILTSALLISDDDTFFPDFDAVVRMLSEQGPVTKPALIGALSESTKQVRELDSRFAVRKLTLSHHLAGRSVGTHQLRRSRDLRQSRFDAADERPGSR